MGAARYLSTIHSQILVAAGVVLVSLILYNRLRVMKRFGKKPKRLQKFALANGGYIGGITNDGNTCFMNSVIQLLALLTELAKFIDKYVALDVTDERMIRALPYAFTMALKNLLTKINGQYGLRGKEFTTKLLLQKMPNGPKQNFFLGYNQEDAQEFYQLVMDLLENEYKKTMKLRILTPDPEEKPLPFINTADLAEVVMGTSKLGQLGDVYVPAAHVDPNLEDAEGKAQRLELITPVDGVQTERIGCMVCGEVGGIRYLVILGLLLNLPLSRMTRGFTIEELLNTWIEPEIIDEVNCNRCGLNQTREFLAEKVLLTDNADIADKFQQRLDEIDSELAKHTVSDEAFERLLIKNMLKKSRKQKQLFLTRPPPFLCMHINRLVFDPNTYMMMKNTANVSFPAVLDLLAYVVEPEDINMDARKPFRRQDEPTPVVKETIGVPEKTEDVGELTAELTAELTTEPTQEKAEPTKPAKPVSKLTQAFGAELTPSQLGLAITNELNEDHPRKHLLYHLKAVIVHYGTHNYGHYICYRKYRGTWWRVSDELVYVVTEQEVLEGHGTFMLFYEYDDGHHEVYQPVLDSEGEENDNDGDDDMLLKLAPTTLTTQYLWNTTLPFQRLTPMTPMTPLTPKLEEDKPDEVNVEEDRAHL